jgi:hypothetical protein
MRSVLMVVVLAACEESPVVWLEPASKGNNEAPKIVQSTPEITPASVQRKEDGTYDMRLWISDDRDLSEDLVVEMYVDGVPEEPPTLSRAGVLTVNVDLAEERTIELAVIDSADALTRSSVVLIPLEEPTP